MGAYVFGPFMAGVLAMTCYGLATMLAGPWAGLLAATLISVSPVTVRHSLYVSSDVPCVAFWMLAWLMSLRPRLGAAVAAGTAVTAATMIRPNTAPLVLVIGVLVLLGGTEAGLSWRRWRWRHALAFGAMSAVGPLLVLWSNTVFYGGPLEAGYKGAAEFFKWEHVLPNLALYPGWLFEVHSPVAVAGLLMLPVALWRARSAPEDRARMVVAVSAVALVALNLLLIVPYLVFAQWTYLRFVLPAMAALFILLSALVVWVAAGLAHGRWTRWLTPVALAPALVVAWHGVPELRAALREHEASRSVLVMGPYLRAALPPNAVILSFMHSGPAAYYSGRPIVRLDIIQPDLDGVIARLQSQGFRPLLLLDEVIESPHVGRIFPGTVYQDLDWPPRATFAAFGRIWLLDPADRARFLAGATYPHDVLR
jgi:4-amino-4-deoxy-L-arabinose transferase-like glycosyltransferase